MKYETKNKNVLRRTKFDTILNFGILSHPNICLPHDHTLATPPGHTFVTPFVGHAQLHTCQPNS
jgi:hypothetical protein